MGNKKELDILLEAIKINKQFGSFIANQDIDICIERGEIHALLGENGAGKSTLVKILYGILKPESGTIKINNEEITISSPNVARKNGIGMVFQHFSLFPALTVAENILIALDQKIKFKDLILRIKELSTEWELFIDPLKIVSELSVGEQQRVEIIRCLMQNPKLLIMDEPTSVLTPQEIENLFKILKRLASSGCSILYISHKLEEIIELANKVTILKSGKSIATIDAKNTTTKYLAETMVGKEITTLKKVQPKNLSKDIALEIRNLNKANTSDFGISLTNINVTVNYGEILGIAGIAGNGQTELMEILSGETICDKEDQIFLDGVPIGFEDITKRRKLGIETIPEERTLHATVPNLKINENTFLTYFPKYNQNRSFIGKILNNPENSLVESEQIIKENDVRCPEPNPMASQLSGGNLQKFILGRSLANNPKVAIFSQPTWGVDIGAATTIRQKLLNLSQTGKAVILISQDLEEIFQLSDKITVLNNGNLSEVLSANDISAANVGLLMGGNSKSQNDQEESK
ncbi:MAG: ABC transporter ATP-binding protein [Alphaproteobacteria bacterium]|nr:ABC transporter ATP-binding protein [Alphaproteobacteria bacterium]